MQENIAKGYRIVDLYDYSEAQLFQLIKTHWGYGNAQPFDIIGCLKERPSSSGGSFLVLEELHSVNDGAILLYPLNETGVHQTIFVGNVKKDQFDNKFVVGTWIKARVELSPETERKKHNNPFALKVVKGGLQLLQAIPEEVTSPNIITEGESHVEQWVIDFYKKLHSDRIEEEGNTLQEQLKQKCESEEGRVSELREEAKILNKKVTQQAGALQKLEDKLAVTGDLQGKTESEFKQHKKTMEHQLKTLNQFIEKKAKMLLELGLVEQQEVDSLLNKVDIESVRQGHDFTDIFSSDITQAISYIQAYMQNKKIIYRRKLLEDFFALLTTHDLIILAGDSGSGKTNLVKSFAEAIGGKAIIIPVKPNWTSAEDLLGYYNPLEQKYLSTHFLDALFESARNPDIPYFICLDEMNLARVEYYFSDFLSLMEERGDSPEIHLYSDTEAAHLVSETRNFLALIDEAKAKLHKSDIVSFLDLLRDEEVNAKLHEMCGFREGDSLLKYHSYLRKLMSSYLNTPSSIRLPPNVRIIGAINVDETTHYLSPKILDRAHIMRFGNPLLADWEQIENEVKNFDLDLSLPIKLEAASLGDRTHYPEFKRDTPLAETLLHLVREYLEPLGIEFGLRTVRQAHLYSTALQQFDATDDLILNNIILHKVLPKLMFDGEKEVNKGIARKDLLVGMRDYLKQRLSGLDTDGTIDFCIDEFDRVIRNAEANDWVVNYWSR